MRSHRRAFGSFSWVFALATASLSAWIPGVARGSPTEVEEAVELDRHVAHAKELLGTHYQRSAVRSMEKVGVHDLELHVKDWVRKALKGKWRAYAKRISRTVIEESRKYEWDPVFLLAVIQSESSFRPTVVGPAGEIGLMQLREATGKWVATRNKIHWKGKKTLRDPVENIRIGSAYLAYLRETFDKHGRLYLAAYNMGPSNVNSAMQRRIWPKEYPARVMKRYIAFYRQLKKAMEKESSPGAAAEVASGSRDQVSTKTK